MQIIIDTQKDSKEDMRKLVAFLSSLSDGAKDHHSNLFEDSSPSLNNSSSQGNAFASMFGSSDPAESENIPVLGTGAIEKKEETKEEDEETPQIIEY